jgi:hypothetical protein
MPANQSFFDSEDFQIPLVIYLILILYFWKTKTGGLFINKIKEPPAQHQLGTETKEFAARRRFFVIHENAPPLIFLFAPPSYFSEAFVQLAALIVCRESNRNLQLGLECLSFEWTLQTPEQNSLNVSGMPGTRTGDHQPLSSPCMGFLKSTNWKNFIPNQTRHHVREDY